MRQGAMTVYPAQIHFRTSLICDLHYRQPAVLESAYSQIRSLHVKKISLFPDTIISVWWSSNFGHINRGLSCRFTLKSIG